MITNLAVQEWLEEIEQAKKREKDYRKDGKEILDIYDGEKDVPFNILYSNTETLVPAVYSQTPKPVVRRRFMQKEGASPLQAAVERASQRMLEYLLDTQVDGYETFDQAMGCAVLDAALPGRGVTQIKFDADMDEDDVSWASVCADSKKWDRVYIGYALKWSKVPWIAFEDYLDREECDELFGEKSNLIKYSENEDDDDKESSANEKSSRKTALIYQIWSKEKKQVLWVSPQYDGYLKEQDDPLGVTGFFPIPKPLQFHRKSNSIKVTALYTMYKNQAIELNRITTRLNAVIEAIKYRAVYDGNFGDELERLIEEGDATYVPTDKMSAFSDGGFAKHIWSVPVGELVGVAQQLYQAREACKQVIYEITGISDILRGSSAASETLGAQKIKEAWGSMRLKNMQKDVQMYARDSLRIMLDIAVENLPQWFWQKVTGLPIPTEEEKQNAIAQLEVKKILDKNKPLPQPGQPEPEEPEGESEPELIAISVSPTWEEVLGVLKDDYIRSYSIDIETNSTLDVEATEDKKIISEFMNAMAQFMNGMAPLVSEGIMPFGAMKTMLLAITQRFRFGREVEEEIKSMSEPKPKSDPKKEQEMKQFQDAQKKFQEAQQKFKQEQEEVTNELDAKSQKLELDQTKFDYEQKLADMEQQFEDKMFEMKKKALNEETSSMLKNMFADNERKLQSQMDKLVVKMEKATRPKAA